MGLTLDVAPYHTRAGGVALELVWTWFDCAIGLLALAHPEAEGVERDKLLLCEPLYGVVRVGKMRRPGV